ncbi:MAG: PKD domain-containing protein [Steroidobacter sp.]
MQTLKQQWNILFLTLLCGLLALITTMSAHAANPPVADMSLSSNFKGAVPLAVHFDGSLSNCDGATGSSGCSNSYQWNFGDGSTASGNFQFFHTYMTAGTYTATLTVTDSVGRKASTTLSVIVTPAESLTAYVQACENQLNFQSSNIPDLDCYDGDLFAPSTGPNDPVNDYLGHKQITDQVDLAFACRWVFGGKTHRKPAVSVELLLHNRQNGNTCFFSAKRQNVQDPDRGTVFGVVSKITLPTSSTADSYWDQPASVDANIRCIGCHVSGPYIATPIIAPYLAKDGLLNNGHDTLSNVSFNDLLTPNKNVKYHAISALVNGVPGAFSQWDSVKQSYINPADSGCSAQCHMIGTKSLQGDIAPSAQQPTMLHGPASILTEIDTAQVMVPYADGSDYRWINLDTPADGVETENLVDAISASTTLVPKLLGNCAAPASAPTMIEAHVVDSNNTFMIAQQTNLGVFPDRLSVFNAKDGLVCLNSDQEPGHTCQDYKIRYECTDPNNPAQKTWTSWYNMDSPSGDGDHEERSKDANVCTSPTGSTVTGIEAATVAVNGWSYNSYGPNDRLARFSPYGLTCNNADQPDGKCSNYVVRYGGCGPAPQKQPNKMLTNVYATGKQLTAAAGSVVKGQAHNSSWNTQQWNIEPIANTEYVRIYNQGTNVYLTVTSTAESATVGTAASSSTTNEMWVIEPVPGASDYRLKNLFSGKYLTIGDPKSFPSTPDYLPIFSQSRNTSWTSQRWFLQ